MEKEKTDFPNRILPNGFETVIMQAKYFLITD